MPENDQAGQPGNPPASDPRLDADPRHLEKGYPTVDPRQTAEPRHISEGREGSYKTK